MPRRIAKSAQMRGPRISTVIGRSCPPGLCQLRHREDVEQGPVSAPTLLMTLLAMLETAPGA
jgi:hypothetical protein